jgi:signal transduction histidine kinase
LILFLRTWCGFLFLSLSIGAAAQNKDSLLQLIPAAKDSKERIHLMYLIMGDSGDNDPEKALHYYKKLLTLAQKLNDKVAEAVMSAETGYALYMMGNTVAGSDLMLKATRMAEETHNQQAIGIAYDNQAFIYDDLQKQKADMHKALTASTAAQDYLFMCWELGNLANMFAEQNQRDSSFYYAQQALKLAITRGVAEVKPIALIQMGWQNYARGQKTVALEYFHAALHEPYTAREAKTAASAYGSLSNYYQAEKKEDSALYYARRAYNSVQNAFYSLRLTPVIMLTKAFERVGNIDSAFKYLKMQDAIRDSIDSREKAKQVANITFNEHQHQLDLANEAVAYKNRLKLYAVFGVLALTVVIVFFLFSRTKKQQKANRLLQQQKEETEAQRTKAETALEELKATQAQLVQREKMASLGELTAGIAHEIQNPLNFVNNFSEINTELLEELKEDAKTGNTHGVIQLAEELKENQQKIAHHGRRADAIVRSMLQHSRASTGEKESTDINALVDEYLQLAYHGMRAKDKSFEVQLQADYDNTVGKIVAVPQDIGRVQLNLFNNAFYATAEKKKQAKSAYQPKVTVSTKRVNGVVEIQVSDNGTGIPKSAMDKVFQPFFTTKPTGEGTGLGLSLSYDIITTGHGGELRVESVEGQYTTFVVRLPT